MIRDEFQYKSTAARLDAQQLELRRKREQLRVTGIPEEQIEQLIGNLISDCRRLEEEVSTYERRTARTWVPAF